MPGARYQNLNHPHQERPRHTMTAPITMALYASIALLMVDAIIEMSLIADMVSWLHNRAGGSFGINYKGSNFSLHGKPASMSTNQGHTSNGAAGTAFVLVGLGGIFVLWLRSRSFFPQSKLAKFLYHFWLIMTIPAVILTLVAIGYTFSIDHSSAHQTIDLAVASKLNNHPYPDYVAYPLQSWTPPNWLAAVLELNLASAADRSDIHLHLNLMKAWTWNLIPLFLIGLVVAVLAILEALHWRRVSRTERLGGSYPLKQGGGYDAGLA